MPQGGPLLERDRELASFRSLLEAARSGAGRVALIEGRAGIGKSRLLAELREQAASVEVRRLATDPRLVLEINLIAVVD